MAPGGVCLTMHIMPPPRRWQTPADSPTLKPQPLRTLFVPAHPTDTFADVWEITQARDKASGYLSAKGHGAYYYRLQGPMGQDICLGDTLEDLGISSSSAPDDRVLCMQQIEFDRESSLMPGSILQPAGWKKRRLSALAEEQLMSPAGQHALISADADTPLQSREAENERQGQDTAARDNDGFRLPRPMKRRRLAAARGNLPAPQPVLLVRNSQTDAVSRQSLSSSSPRTSSFVASSAVGSALPTITPRAKTPARGMPTIVSPSFSPPHPLSEQAAPSSEPRSVPKSASQRLRASASSLAGWLIRGVDKETKRDRAQDVTPGAHASRDARRFVHGTDASPEGLSVSVEDPIEDSGEHQSVQEASDDLRSGAASENIPHAPDYGDPDDSGMNFDFSRSRSAGLGLRPWTSEEDQVLKRLIAEGYDTTEIVSMTAHLNRTKESIRKKVKRLEPEVLEVEKQSTTFPASTNQQDGWTDRDRLKLRRAYRDGMSIGLTGQTYFKSFNLHTVEQNMVAYRRQMESLQRSTATSSFQNPAHVSDAASSVSGDSLCDQTISKQGPPFMDHLDKHGQSQSADDSDSSSPNQIDKCSVLSRPTAIVVIPKDELQKADSDTHLRRDNRAVSLESNGSSADVGSLVSTPPHRPSFHAVSPDAVPPQRPVFSDVAQSARRRSPMKQRRQRLSERVDARPDVQLSQEFERSLFSQTLESPFDSGIIDAVPAPREGLGSVEGISDPEYPSTEPMKPAARNDRHVLASLQSRTPVQLGPDEDDTLQPETFTTTHSRRKQWRRHPSHSRSSSRHTPEIISRMDLSPSKSSALSPPPNSSSADAALRVTSVSGPTAMSPRVGQPGKLPRINGSASKFMQARRQMRALAGVRNPRPEEAESLSTYTSIPVAHSLPLDEPTSQSHEGPNNVQGLTNTGGSVSTAPEPAVILPFASAEPVTVSPPNPDPPSVAAASLNTEPGNRNQSPRLSGLENFDIVISQASEKSSHPLPESVRRCSSSPLGESVRGRMSFTGLKTSPLAKPRNEPDMVLHRGSRLSGGTADSDVRQSFAKTALGRSGFEVNPAMSHHWAKNDEQRYADAVSAASKPEHVSDCYNVLKLRTEQEVAMAGGDQEELLRLKAKQRQQRRERRERYGKSTSRAILPRPVFKDDDETADGEVDVMVLDTPGLGEESESDVSCIWAHPPGLTNGLTIAANDTKDDDEVDSVSDSYSDLDDSEDSRTDSGSVAGSTAGSLVDRPTRVEDNPSDAAIEVSAMGMGSTSSSQSFQDAASETESNVRRRGVRNDGGSASASASSSSSSTSSPSTPSRTGPTTVTIQPEGEASTSGNGHNTKSAELVHRSPFRRDKNAESREQPSQGNSIDLENRPNGSSLAMPPPRLPAASGQAPTRAAAFVHPKTAQRGKAQSIATSISATSSHRDAFAKLKRIAGNGFLMDVPPPPSQHEAPVILPVKLPFGPDDDDENSSSASSSSSSSGSESGGL